MAKWVKHKSATGSLEGYMEFGDKPGEAKFKAEGDISAAKDMVQQSRESKRTSHFQHMAEIPNVIILELQMKHNIDILSPDFMGDQSQMRRLKYILQTEYPELLVMT